jgi:hypothetical protein
MTVRRIVLSCADRFPPETKLFQREADAFTVPDGFAPGIHGLPQCRICRAIANGAAKVADDADQVAVPFGFGADGGSGYDARDV